MKCKIFKYFQIPSIFPSDKFSSNKKIIIDQHFRQPDVSRESFETTLKMSLTLKFDPGKCFKNMVALESESL